MIKENFIKLYENSFKENWDLPCYTDYGEDTTFTYGQVAEEIAKIHLLFQYCSLRRGDKISIIGKNTSRWCIAYLATVTYGAIVVPILQDFKPNDVHHIVNHSESTFLFTSDNIWENLEEEALSGLRAVFSLTDFRCLHQRDGETVQKFMKNMDAAMKKNFPKGFYKENINYTELSNEKVMLLNYTSGTTGFSKGVMITGNNLAGNVTFGIRTELLKKGEKVLSFLPLAHAYGAAFDMLTPLAAGSHVTLLDKLPTPVVLLKAFAEVRPNLILCVPLILEKIYRKQILPLLERKGVKRMLSVPFVDRIVYNNVRSKLVSAFGGAFSQVIVGGAPLNGEVEEFLHKIKFPFTVGYGMTECGPLISYTFWKEFIVGSSGRTLPGIMQSRVDSNDPENIPGEICVRGQNVMKGYYKNPEATEAVLDPDGWLHTGDMGTRTPDGTLFIKGRYKTMILTATGQNIYPEEIEAKLNNMPYVTESLIVERSGHLVAIVYPDYEAMDRDGITSEQLPEMMETIRKDLNKRVAPYERIDRIQLRPTEFEKTPKKSIKRFLYAE